MEGYTDCIMAHQADCQNVVATLGTSLTSGHARILKRYAQKIVLLFDSDTAGLEATNRALDICLEQHIDIKIASVPQGKDPCDFILTAGGKSFRKLADEATDIFKYKWTRLTESLNSSDTLTGRKNAIEEFLQTIVTAIKSGNIGTIDRGLIINRLCGLIGLDSSQLNRELSRRLKKQSFRPAGYAASSGRNQPAAAEPLREYDSTVSLGEGFCAAAQREIIEVLLNKPELFSSVKQKITVESFDVPILRQIAEALFDVLQSGRPFEPAEVISNMESAQTGSIVAELVQSGEAKGNFESRLDGAIEAILSHHRQKEKLQIRQQGDQTEFLRKYSKNTGKQNPHNTGMI